MGNAMSDEAGLSRKQVRIEATLDWYFNFADADLGLRSNHEATVAVLTNPGGQSVPSADAAEYEMFRAVEAIRRYRDVSAIVNRMSRRDQGDLYHCYRSRQCPRELASRPTPQRWFAASSPIVRSYLIAHGRKAWALEEATAVLVLAECSLREPDAAELRVLRTDAWAFAERALGQLLARYLTAERAHEAAEAAAQAERFRKSAAAALASASRRRLS
jgi:hypothetical protein